MSKLDIKDLEQRAQAYLNNGKYETGIIPLDYILSGGIKDKGDIIQIVGESMTGRTTLALQLAKSYCKNNKKVVYIDTCNNVDCNKIESLKIKDDLQVNLFFYKCTSFEEISEVIDENLKLRHIDLIVLDSLADVMNKGYFNMTGKKIGIENNNSNYDSRPLSLFIRKYTALSFEYGYSMLLTNQFRNRIHKKLGTINKRYGPKTLDYSCNVILEMQKSKDNRFSEFVKPINFLVPMEFNVVKCSSYNKSQKIPFLYNKINGIDFVYTAINEAIAKGTINQSGGFYSFGNIKEKGLEEFLQHFPKDVWASLCENQKHLIINYYKDLK